MEPKTREDFDAEQVARLMEAAAEEAGVSVEEMKSDTKRREVVDARQLCIYPALRHLGFSTRRLARVFPLQTSSIYDQHVTATRKREQDPWFREASDRVISKMKIAA